MAGYEIREFYGKEVIPFLKLSSIMFRSKNALLADEEALEKFIIEDEKKRGTDFIRLGAFYENKLYSGIVCNDFYTYFDRKKVKMSGIGGVVSDFNSPIKGGMKEIYKKAFSLMREKGQYISHLYPFEENYYRRFGYEISAQASKWDIPMDKITHTGKGKTYPYDGSEEMQKDIIKVYDDFSVDKNLITLNSEKDWKNFFESIKPYVSDKVSFIHYNEQGTADAFMTYVAVPQDNKPQSAVVKTIWFSDISSLKNILSYFKTQKAYCDNLILPLPENIDISPFIDSTGGWGTRHTKRTVMNYGTTRIVDVEQILALANYKGEGQVCIKIYDDTFAPWNNDCFTVKFGKSTKVTRGGNPDIEMNINSFSSGILGRCDLENLILFDDVKINNCENLEKVFYKKSVYTEKHF